MTHEDQEIEANGTGIARVLLRSEGWITEGSGMALVDEGDGEVERVAHDGGVIAGRKKTLDSVEEVGA